MNACTFDRVTNLASRYRTNPNSHRVVLKCYLLTESDSSNVSAFRNMRNASSFQEARVVLPRIRHSII